ncbi:MAG: hypothetical protein OXF79_27970 [Chloroflexi bacterium]|nr:hypothetical protein [Chloroflexota bacterium]
MSDDEKTGVAAHELGLQAHLSGIVILCGGCAAIRAWVPIPVMWATAALAIHVLALASQMMAPGSRAEKRLAGAAAEWAGDLQRMRQAGAAALKWLAALLAAFAAAAIPGPAAAIGPLMGVIAPATTAAALVAAGPASAWPFGAIGVLAPQFGIAAAVPVLPLVAGVAAVAVGGVLIYRARKRARRAR